jgi:hypothetical protein
MPVPGPLSPQTDITNPRPGSGRHGFVKVVPEVSRLLTVGAVLPVLGWPQPKLMDPLGAIGPRIGV